MWLSPWQVAHLLSIVHMVKENVPQVDPLLPDPSTDLTDSVEPRGHKPPSLTTQLRVTGVFEVPLLVVLCLVRALERRAGRRAGMCSLWSSKSFPHCRMASTCLDGSPHDDLANRGPAASRLGKDLRAYMFQHVVVLPAPQPSFSAATSVPRLMHASSPAAGAELAVWRFQCEPHVTSG